MSKKTLTSIATAALITTAGITATHHVKALNSDNDNVVKAATNQQNQQFINKAASAAVESSSKYGTYTSVMMAQAAVESGWGQSSLSQSPNNNLFGIKGSYNGQSVTVKTGEYINGSYKTVNASFKKYPSYTESFNDNGSLIRKDMGSTYSGAWVENASTPEQATQQGLQGKYATAPNYASTLNSIIEANNFKQYDPVTTNVNEVKKVVKTTPITDAPVDSDVGKQIGTARVGQQMTISKYITYKNGVTHALTQLGWVNNSAFGASATVKTTTQATKTVVQKPKKKKSYTYIKTSEVVKITNAPTEGAPVLKSPNGKKNGKTLPLNSTWKVNGYAIVKGVRYNHIGSKQWLSSIYTNPAKEVSQAPKEKEESTVKKTTSKKTKVEKDYEKVEGSFIVTAKNIEVWSAPTGKKTGQLLPKESDWKITGKKEIKGKTWYRLGKTKWIQSTGIKVDNLKKVAVSQAPAKPKTKVEYPVYKSTGVVTINSKPNYGVPVYTKPGEDATKRILSNGTNWKFFKIAVIKGEKWYNLGGNQWVPEKYVLVR
ncbi:muramidase [Lactobacillus sp. PV037]|uniref:glycoside hydrolase family 73 protein n=1 Tax=unclassified Lactobacillus TaxID=2620435 RepID=UPI00223F1571|nr:MULTISPECIES: glycoside hydrolase family 73 protein [unclassified Lactobacillus]QNQ81743.1 muramidase [Lactobacillus sp. PV012]QNQ84212.1 muramidase [Lactobacillus sp. PV037]